MIKLSSIAALLLLAVQGALGQGAAPQAAPDPYESGPPSAPANPIDRAVFGRLAQLGIQPANLCSDAVFVRRVYLDAIGTLPTAQEARAFIIDRTPDKRRALIDRLLARDEFVDTWAMKWSDLLRVKAEFPINLWPNAVQAYYRWIHEAIKTNMPYDRFARELLTASGSNFREGPVNFYRALQNKDPQSLAQAVALTFMGVRADKWPKERLAGMAGFFSQVGYKCTEEWKEEIVYFDPDKGGDAVKKAVFPDGSKPHLAPDQDPRVAFADWLITPRNPWFTRNIANRAWYWLVGRGVIQPPDDVRDDNPPSNPELLACLERELVTAHYDMKQFFRLILNSQAYQLSSIPKSKDPRAEANFASYPLRRLDAEVLIDALCQITGTTEKYSSAIPEPFTFIPEEQRSIALADGSITSPFLEMFGRSSRDTGLESERNNKPSAAQRLHLLNSSHIQKKIEQSRKLQGLIQSGGNPRQIVDNLYLTILSRFPTPQELQTVAEYIRPGAGANAFAETNAFAGVNARQQNKAWQPGQAQGKAWKAGGRQGKAGWPAKGQGAGRRLPPPVKVNLSREAAVDLVWALFNSPEFLYRH